MFESMLPFLTESPCMPSPRRLKALTGIKGAGCQIGQVVRLLSPSFARISPISCKDQNPAGVSSKSAAAPGWIDARMGVLMARLASAGAS